MYKEIPSGTKPVLHPCIVGWRARVDEAEKRGKFTESEFALAMNWNQCACGEAYNNIFKFATEFKSDPMPTDSRLKQLGGDFAGYVGTNKFKKCRDCLTAIEKRLAELICK